MIAVASTLPTPPARVTGLRRRPYSETIFSTTPRTGACVLATIGSSRASGVGQEIKNAAHATNSDEGGGWHTEHTRRPERLSVHHRECPHA